MADNALTKLSLNGQIGASLAAAALVGGLFYYFYYADAVQERDDKTAKLEALSKEIRALEVTAQQAAGVPARGRAAGGEARDPEADPARRPRRPRT